MNTILGAYGAALLATSLASPVLAQTAGTYSGTSADGNTITLQLAGDFKTGQLMVFSAEIDFTAPCNDSTYVLSTGWGIGLKAPVTSQSAHVSATGTYYNFQIDLEFSTDSQSATGTIVTISPSLTPIGPHPTHAVICTSPQQNLTLTLQPDDDAQRQQIPPSRGTRNEYRP